MLSNYCYKHFRFIGAHPELSFGKLHFIFNMSIIICFSVMVSYKIYIDKDLKSLESFIYFTIVTPKYLCLLFGKKIVRQLIETSKLFWKSEVADHQVTFLLEHPETVQKFYKKIFIIGVVTVGIKPFVMQGPSIFNIYMPPQIPFPLFYAVEFYLLLFGASVFISFNIFICPLIISVVVQFRCLNLNIKNLDFSRVKDNHDLQRLREELRSIIKHQQLLIRYVTDLNKLLCVPLSAIMSSSVTTMCINMYLLSKCQSLADWFRVLVTSSAVIVECFLVYGLPGQLLMDESADTANIIYYECEWFLPAVRPLRIDFLLMIMRSQKKLCIRAANYHIISNETPLLMLKTAYSFYAFLHKVA